MVGSRLSQFHELAKYYDAINDWKDYGRESDRVEAIARRLGRGGRTSWLDVACGTGRHLEHLRERHPVVGVDGSREMLRIARRRLPGVRLVEADMRTFRLGQRFDVVTCLFSAIAHLPRVDDVARAFANFARHLNPGGVLIVEPWIERSAFRPGYLDLRVHESPEVTVARLAFSSRRGDRSVVNFQFLVGTPGRGIQHFDVTDEGLLFSRAELLGLARQAGLRPRFLARGLMPRRGLLVGIKPRSG